MNGVYISGSGSGSVDMTQPQFAPSRAQPQEGIRLDYASLAARARRWMPDERTQQRATEISDELAARAHAAAPSIDQRLEVRLALVSHGAGVLVRANVAIHWRILGIDRRCVCRRANVVENGLLQQEGVNEGQLRSARVTP